MRPGLLPKVRAIASAHKEALMRWGQVYGWCRAMLCLVRVGWRLWCYGVYGWSKISRRALESLIKKLERDKPLPGAIHVTVRKPTAQQREFLKWSCDYFGFGYKEE